MTTSRSATGAMPLTGWDSKSSDTPGLRILELATATNATQTVTKIGRNFARYWITSVKYWLWHYGCMSELLFTFGILLWLTLAIATGFHAKGHNRSGIIIFCFVAITGIFGVAFYLLSITSANSVKSAHDSQTDKKIIMNIPLVVLGFVGGILIGMGVALVIDPILGPARRPEPYYGLILLLGFVGAGSGPYAYSRAKLKLAK